MEVKRTVALDRGTEIEAVLPNMASVFVTLEGEGINTQVVVRDSSGIKVIGMDTALFN